MMTLQIYILRGATLAPKTGSNAPLIDQLVMREFVTERPLLGRVREQLERYTTHRPLSHERVHEQPA